MGKIQESNPTIEDLRRDVPFIVYEGTQARNERTVKRLITALVLTIILTFASNGAWLYAWLQYDYSGVSSYSDYTQDGQGLNIIGDRNGVDYGAETKESSNSQDTDTEK